MSRSKHFARIWKSVMQVASVALEECDPIFVQRCHPARVDESKLSASVEQAYRRIRDELRVECYGRKDGPENLDARKIAAVMCCALSEQKVLVFNSEEAAVLLMEKEAALKREAEPDRTSFNRWIVNNFFINYKIAYLTGLRIILDTLISELLMNPNTTEYGKTLAEQGRPTRYPITPMVDSFDVSMVLGLGRSGMRRETVSAFLLALHFYQIEMYTRKSLGLDQ